MGLKGAGEFLRQRYAYAPIDGCTCTTCESLRRAAITRRLLGEPEPMYQVPLNKFSHDMKKHIEELTKPKGGETL